MSQRERRPSRASGSDALTADASARSTRRRAASRRGRVPWALIVGVIGVGLLVVGVAAELLEARC